MKKLTQAIQESLLCILCFDSEPDGAPFVRGYVPVESFDPFYKDIAKEAVEFFDRYSRPPGEQTLDLVESLSSRDETKADAYQRIYASLLETNEGIVKKFVLDQASKFVRFQRTRKGIAEAIDALEEEDVDGAAEALRRADQSQIEVFDPGVFLTDTKRTFEAYSEDAEAFPTGITKLDQLGLGPARGRLHVFVGPPKAGKSWWLLHLAKKAMAAGKRVLYISLELSEAELSGRFYQSLFSMTKRESEIAVQRFVRPKDSKTVILEERVLKKLETIKPHDKVWKKKLRKKVESVLTRKPKVLLKSFPSGSLTIPSMKSYLSGLEGIGFLPDLICVDYGDLFSIDVANYRQSLGRVYVDLRGIAVERDCAVATASQTNREGAGRKIRTERDVAEDFSKIATADSVVTYNQTRAERLLGLARLYQAVARTDEDKFEVHISQAYGIGQFCLDSTSFVSNYWNEVEDRTDEDDDDD